jgi:transposase-like protein
MAITLEEFQEAVQTRRRDRKHGASRYDQGLVSFAVQHAQAVVTSGGSVHAAAKELGISMMTLQSRQRRVGASPRSGRLRKVVVSSPTPSAAVAGCCEHCRDRQQSRAARVCVCCRRCAASRRSTR